MAVRSKKPVIQWPPQDWIELLAHLDLLTKDGKGTVFSSPGDREQHKNDVLRVLRSKLHNQYAVSEIERKLWDSFRGDYDYPHGLFPLVFIHGSSQIISLEDAIRERVAEECKSIRLKTPRGRRAATVQGTSKSELNVRRTRSIRASVTSGVQKPGKTTPRKTIVKRISTPKKAHMPFESIVPRTNKQETERSTAADHGMRTKPTTTDKRQVSARKKWTSTRTGSRRTSRSITEDLSSSNAHACKSTPLRLTEGTTPNVHVSIACSSRQTTPSPAGPESGQSTRVCSKGVHDFDDLMLSAAHYRCRARDAEADNAELEIKIRKMSSFHEQLNMTGTTIREWEESQNKDQYIRSLEKQRQERKYLEPYLDLRPTRATAPNAAQVYEAFTGLHNQLSMMIIPELCSLSKNDLDALPPKSDLKSLLSYITSPGVASEAEELLHNSENLQGYTLARALTSAAVCLWVFREEVGMWEMRSTPLLETFRTCIKIAGGKDTLDKIELAAHQFLLEDTGFQEVRIPQHASQLADRLFNVLLSLTTEHWKPQARSEFQRALTQVFCLAIQTRCMGVGAAKGYELVFPPCGSEFDHDSMTKEASYIADPKTLVQLPLVPGVRTMSYSEKHGKSGDPNGAMVKALVLV